MSTFRNWSIGGDLFRRNAKMVSVVKQVVKEFTLLIGTVI